MNEQLRILVVDDEPAVRAALRLAMRKRPWQIEFAESGEAAMGLFQASTFDFALIDKNLPGMTGVELIREIRKTDQDLGVIMITGYASVESAVETLHLGIDAYLEKPFDNIYDVVRKIAEVQVARKSRSLSGRLAAANGHLREAMEKLRGVSKDASGLDGLTILVACPEAAERQWLAKQFRSGAAKVICVASSAEALVSIDATSPDLVIIDSAVEQPDLLSMLATLKVQTPHAGLMVLAEKDPNLSVLTRLIDLGVRVIVNKPLDPTTFRAKLKDVASDAGRITPPAEQAEVMR